MKKITAILLLVIIALSSVVFAEENTLNFNLSANGKNNITVPSGSTITVTFTVENSSPDTEYFLNSIQNEIKFDENFFSFVNNSVSFTAKTAKGGIKDKFAGKRVYLNDSEATYKKSQIVGSFKLLVKATSGSGKVESTEMLAFDENAKPFAVYCTDLIVNIGQSQNNEGSNPPSDGGGGIGGGGSTTAKYTVSFKTTDGIVLDKIQKNDGTILALSAYTFAKEGYKFEGWYTDKELTNKVTSIKIDKDITLYAKWVEASQGEQVGNRPSILTDVHYAYIVGRENNLVAPHDNITRAEVATIFFRLLTEEVRNDYYSKENSFDDVNSGDWFNTAVSTLTNMDIITGRSDTQFAPNDFITRAEFATIAARFSKGEYIGEALFADISGHWAESYINRAASLGWIVGDNGLFRPNDNITRAEAMTLTNRVLCRQPEIIDDILTEKMVKFADNTDVNAWYYLAVQEATNSHDYKMKEDGVHEKWTALTENPDWSKLEK